MNGGWDIRKVNQEIFTKGLKHCPGCKTQLQLSMFGKDKHGTDGLNGKCKKCRRVENKKYFDEHPEVRDKHNERNREKRKEYYSDPVRKRKYRSQDLKYKFGLTADDYDKMLAEQGGVCLICKQHRIASNKYHMVIDHCHETGKVRGVLCNWCNRGIGLFQDKESWLLSAIDYLKRFK